MFALPDWDLWQFFICSEFQALTRQRKTLLFLKWRWKLRSQTNFCTELSSTFKTPLLHVNVIWAFSLLVWSEEKDWHLSESVQHMWLTLFWSEMKAAVWGWAVRGKEMAVWGGGSRPWADEVHSFPFPWGSYSFLVFCLLLSSNTNFWLIWRPPSLVHYWNLLPALFLYCSNFPLVPSSSPIPVGRSLNEIQLLHEKQQSSEAYSPLPLSVRYNCWNPFSCTETTSLVL